MKVIIVMLVVLSFSFSHVHPDTAYIWVDVTTPETMTIDHRLWGSNQTQYAPADLTIYNPDYIQKVNQIGIQMLRWPGGNHANSYNWKMNQIILPGYRKNSPDETIIDAIGFIENVNSEMTITINYGTMTAQDAADMVEFLNGPSTTEWGSLRASQGYLNPLNIEYFEIGNENGQSHTWDNCWSAEDAMKYFMGGEEERRGFIDYVENPFKGDFFQATTGMSNYYLRFSPVKNLEIQWIESTRETLSSLIEEFGGSYILDSLFEYIPEVNNFSNVPSNVMVFSVDTLSGEIQFGNGNNGRAPTDSSFFLVEYTVYDQDGFLDYARAMRAVESSIPIKIGATMLPIDGENVIPIEIDSLSEIFTEMDFWILHQYNSGTPYNNYQLRRQLSDNRISNMIDRQNLIQDFLNYTNINREIGLAITEWNMFLKDTYQPIDRTIECAIFTTQWMVGILNGEMNGNFNFNYAEQFALHGGNLSLISVYGEPHRVISPTAYVFKGFKPWVNMELLPLIIESPEELAYDKEIELIQTAVSRNITGDTLRMVITNNSEIDTIRCNLDLENFNYNTIQIQKLTGENYFSNNDIDANNVTLISEYLYINDNLLFIPPHSVNFLTLFYSELLGDINQDGEVNILDIIIAVDLTLNNEFNPLADLNSDRNVNVVDIVQIINIILEE